MSRLGRGVSALLLLTLAAAPLPGSQPAGATCLSSVSPPDSTTPTATTLKARIEWLLTEAPAGRWGIYIHNLDTDEGVSFNGDGIFHPASTIKVGIAVDTLAWLEQHPTVKLSNGPARAGRSFQQLLSAMLVQSEEAATASLTEFLNTQPGFGLNRQLKKWGAACSSVTPRRATPADLALLVEKLYRGELVSASSTEQILNLLREPSPDDTARLGRGLPWAVRRTLAHKTGTLYQDGLDVVADVGLVSAPAGHYVIAVIGNEVDWSDYYAAMRWIGEVSRAAYQAFGPGEGAVECPPDTFYEYTGFEYPAC